MRDLGFFTRRPRGSLSMKRPGLEQAAGQRHIEPRMALPVGDTPPESRARESRLHEAELELAVSAPSEAARAARIAASLLPNAAFARLPAKRALELREAPRALRLSTRIARWPTVLCAQNPRSVSVDAKSKVRAPERAPALHVIDLSTTTQ